VEEDVLDFSADFWEKRLDTEPDSADNIYSQEQKGLSYASDDFRGFDPVSVWMQTPSDETGEVSHSSAPNRRAKGRAKAKNCKHHSAAS
jgi:hypothetical protein